MTFLHGALLRLLPARLRGRYGDEIARVFAEQRATASWIGRLGLWIKEIAAILAVASRRPRTAGPAAAPGREPRWDDGWLADLRYAARLLGRSPLHVATSVLCLAVGLAATLTVYSFVNTLLFGAWPGVADRGTLARVFFRGQFENHEVGLVGISPAQFDVLRDHGPTILSVAGQSDQIFAVRVGDDTVSLSGSFVSGDYFATLGTRPVVGRLLSAADEANDVPAAVVSERFWRTHLGGTSDALGTIVSVSDRDLRIVGVVPAGFPGYDIHGLAEGWTAPQFWVPLSLADGWPGVAEDRPLLAVAIRAAPGANMDDHRADLAVSTARMPPVRPFDRLSPNPKPLGRTSGDSPAELASMIAVMLAGPLTLLAIGCANVASLQLARSSERARELAVRLSLGASRWRVVRLLAVEAAWISTAAVVVGWIATEVLLAQLSGVLPILVEPDWRVLTAAAGLALVVAVAAGVAPAWLAASRIRLGGLTLTRQSGARAHTRLRHSLVAVQIALSLALLAIGALLGRTLQEMTGNLPASTREVLVATVDVENSGLDETGAAQLARRLLDRLDTHAAVRASAVAAASDVFPTLNEEEQVFLPNDSEGGRRFARVRSVSTGYSDATGRPVLAGRPLTAADVDSPFVLVNETMARLLTPEAAAAVGRSFDVKFFRADPTNPQTSTMLVVGVVQDGLRRPDSTHTYAEILRPIGETLPLTFTVYVRAADPHAFIPVLRSALTTLEPRAPWMTAATAYERVLEESGPFRLVGYAAGALGASGLLLAATGLFAVVAFLVSTRTREIGVRMAVGATPFDVSRLVLGQAARLVVIGGLAGLTIALPVAFVMRSTFVGISPFDPLALVPTIAVLGLVAALASILPARRAARIDPVVALRSE